MDPATVKTLTDPLAIRRLLEKAADADARTLIGVASEEGRYESSMIQVDRAASTVLVRRPEGLPARAAGGRACLVLVFAPGMQALGFVARVESAREGVLRMPLPEKAFQLQRRREARIEIPAGYDLAVKLPSPEARGKWVRRRLLDLSPRGFSFLVVSREDLERYATGRFLRQLLLEVHGRMIAFDAQVRNQVKLPGGGTKIGASFLRLAPADREFIEALCLARLAPFVIDRGHSRDERR